MLLYADYESGNEEVNSRPSERRNQHVNLSKTTSSNNNNAFMTYDYVNENSKKETNQSRIEISEEDGEDEDDEFVQNGLERRPSYEENDEEKCTAQAYETMKVCYRLRKPWG